MPYTLSLALEFEESAISKIIINASSYSEGSIKVFFLPNTLQDQISVFDDLSALTEQPLEIDHSNSSLLFPDITLFSHIIHCSRSNQLIKEDATIDVDIALQTINKYLEQRALRKSALKNDQMNPLLLGLTKNDLSMVRTALENKDANQFFSNGDTPLITALLNNCSDDILKLILSFMPDVNQWNRYGTRTPLYLAIRNARELCTKLLLEARAEVLTPCGPRQFGTQEMPKFQAAPPIFIAMDAYLTRPTPSLKNIIATILHYGGGFGIHFSGDGAAKALGEDKPVIIIGGSLIRTKMEVNTIKNVEEFKLSVGIEDYSHWLQVCNNSLPNIEPHTELSFEVLSLRNHIENTLSNIKSTSAANAANLLSTLTTNPVSNNNSIPIPSTPPQPLEHFGNVFVAPLSSIAVYDVDNAALLQNTIKPPTL